MQAVHDILYRTARAIPIVFYLHQADDISIQCHHGGDDFGTLPGKLCQRIRSTWRREATTLPIAVEVVEDVKASHFEHPANRIGCRRAWVDRGKGYRLRGLEPV